MSDRSGFDNKSKLILTEAEEVLLSLFTVLQNELGILLTCRFRLHGSELGLPLCISNTLPGEADASRPASVVKDRTSAVLLLTPV